MIKYQRDEILKLSEEGLDRLYKYNPGGRERASQWRFRYRCHQRKYPDSISVIRVGKGYYQGYHQSFLEKA